MDRALSRTPQARATSTRLRSSYWLWVGLICCAGLLLRAKALSGTLLADDWDHYAMTTGIYPVRVAAWDMFNFVGSTEAARDPLRMTGRLPWWAASNIHLAVFRPLSSLLVHFDYAALGGYRAPTLLRAHTFVWWIVLLLAVAAVLRRALPQPAALVGLALYAIDDAHVYPVAWIANRSEIVAIAFVIWALWAHIEARRRPDRPWLRWLAYALAVLGLLAGEHAFAPLCYVVAWELCRTTAPLERRMLELLPYALLAGSYLVIRSALGYGVAGSAFYIDPSSEPLRYLATAATRVPLLLGDLIFGAPAEWWYWGPPWRESGALRGWVPEAWLNLRLLQNGQIALGVVAAALSALAVAALTRTRARIYARGLGWLLVGAMLSLLPLSGTAAMSRLTVAPALGFCALFGYVLWKIASSLRAPGAVRPRVLGVLLAIAVLQLQGVRAAIVSYEGTEALANVSRRDARWVTTADFGRSDLSRTHVIILSAHDMATQYFLPYIITACGSFPPLSSHLLSPAADNKHVLRRPSGNVLEIEYPYPIRGQPFVPMVYRADGLQFYRGERFPGAVFDVEVLAVRDGNPQRMRFTFRENLEDSRYVFLYPFEEGLIPLQLPSVGETLSLDPPPWPL